jgi:hypothetical protein
MRLSGLQSNPRFHAVVAIGIAGTRLVGTIAFDECDRLAAGAVRRDPHR